MRIPFKGREAVVRQVQKALGLRPDGDDRQVTWQAIVEALPLQPVPQIPFSLSVEFPQRDAITTRVQRALGGVMVDGDDGSETWSGLAQRFDPLLKQADVAPAMPQELAPGVSKTFLGEFNERVVETPNYSRRRDGKPRTNDRKGIILHHASGYYEGTVSWCMNRKAAVSYHCLVATDGRRTQIARDELVAWHAGESRWRGRNHCNSFTLGVAVTGNTNDGAMRGEAGRHLTAAETASIAEWCIPRMERYGLGIADITTHRAVSPGRKDDTSERALRDVVAMIEKKLRP